MASELSDGNPFRGDEPQKQRIGSRGGQGGGHQGATEGVTSLHIRPPARRVSYGVRHNVSFA